MNIKEEFDFLNDRGLNIAIFGKDFMIKKSDRSSKELNLFVVVTWPKGDELCYSDTIPEVDLNRLKNWIRCGDLTGLAAEWRELDTVGFKVKAYLAGENPGIDCSAVASEMFLNKDGKDYTYDIGEESTVRIRHPQHRIKLSEHSGKFWRAAKDFSDLINLNRKFLLGQIPETPYHCGPIMEETIPLVPGLLRLHDFGLFTIGSQPYEHEFENEGNELSEWQQIPFVSFIMSGRDSQYLKLFEKLKERTDIVVAAQELCPFRILDGSHDPYIVTRVRKGENDKDLETAEWDYNTNVCSVEDVSYYVSENFPAMGPEKAVLFDVAGSEWGVQLNVLDVVKEVVGGLDQPLCL